MALNPALAKMQTVGAIKVAGEHSLTVGEIIFSILGVLIIVWGHKIPFVGKYLGNEKARLVLGLGLIFAAEWIW